ncbi:hypothetical protein D5086_012227 [Populus alba]|uniref:Uncharacterized protein n=1 Tax=Populus alba TaxID=43335 RepID=A0ACC4C225_POPAL
MDDPSSLATTLAWHWVIEYLASFPKIEALILHGEGCNPLGDLGAPAWRIDGSDTDEKINAPEENFIHLRGIEVEGDSCNRNSLHFKRDISGLANENLVRDLEDQNCVDDDDHLHLQAKRFKQDALYRHGKCLDPDNAFQHNQYEIAHNANKIPQDISGDGLHLYSLVDEINCVEPKISNTAPSAGTPNKFFVNENKDNSDHSGKLKPSNSLCHPDATVRTNHISNREKVGEEMVQENSSRTGLDRNQHKVCVDPNDSDVDQSTYPVMPQLRRKKVPWTVQEEEMLKKGVQKFSSDGKFPWKDILEYGSSVFFSDRTTIDVKDKWRNMCKPYFFVRILTDDQRNLCPLSYTLLFPGPELIFMKS